MAPLCLLMGGVTEAADLIGQLKSESEAWHPHFLLLPLPSCLKWGMTIFFCCPPPSVLFLVFKVEGRDFVGAAAVVQTQVPMLSQLPSL